jgi:hypothetical protein
MQLTINIGYDQVFELVRQLPPRERRQLFLESEFSAAIPKPPPSTASNEEMSDERYYEFLMNFPVVSEEEIEHILEAKREVNQCRREALRLALECPVATQEEIENQNEYRKRFRCRPM